MEESAPPPPFLAKFRRFEVSAPRAAVLIVIAVVLGIGAAAVWQQMYLKPLHAAAVVRHRAHFALMRLHDLQVAYRRDHGVYANDLDSLLTQSPNGAKLRDKLKLDVDLNTLTVLGDANHFRLEANVLDPERTLVKIRGPLSAP